MTRCSSAALRTGSSGTATCPGRQYQAAVFQGRYAPRENLTFSGAWTIQLQNEGNYEGEEEFEPAITSRHRRLSLRRSLPMRNLPDGRLRTFQRHRARVWAIYLTVLKEAGDLSVSGLWRFESGRPYSLMATNEPLTDIQHDLLARLRGRARDQPGSVLHDRGSETFPSHGLFDVSRQLFAPGVPRRSPVDQDRRLQSVQQHTLMASTPP